MIGCVTGCWKHREDWLGSRQFVEEQPDGAGSSEGTRESDGRFDTGQAGAAGLLTGFESNLLPAGEAFGRGLREAWLRANGFPGLNAVDAQFSGFFDEVFETIKLEERRKQGNREGLGRGGQRFEDAEGNDRFARSFDLGKVKILIVGEFVDLTPLCAKHPDEVFGVGAGEFGGVAVECGDKEAAAGHGVSVGAAADAKKKPAVAPHLRRVD